MVDTFIAPAPNGAVAVTGGDRVDYLNSVLSQRLVDLGTGAVAGALLLDAKGRCLAMIDVVVEPDRIVLVTPTKDLAREVAETLGGRTFLADASFTPLDVIARALRGPRAHAVAESAGIVVDAGRGTEVEDVIVVSREAGLDLLGSEPDVDELTGRLRAAGATPGDANDLEVWRVDSGVPGWATEVGPPHLPEEMGLLPSHVHLDKGCYPGQEAVARMWMLGRPRRRLARVDLTGDVDAGWTAGSGRRAVEVTSVVARDSDRVGLAYVPADAAPGDRFEEDGASVVVRDIVGADAEVPGHDPNAVRRRDKRAGDE